MNFFCRLVCDVAAKELLPYRVHGNGSDLLPQVSPARLAAMLASGSPFVTGSSQT